MSPKDLVARQNSRGQGGWTVWQMKCLVSGAAGTYSGKDTSSCMTVCRNEHAACANRHGVEKNGWPKYERLWLNYHQRSICGRATLVPLRPHERQLKMHSTNSPVASNCWQPLRRPSRSSRAPATLRGSPVPGCSVPGCADSDMLFDPLADRASG